MDGNTDHVVMIKNDKEEKALVVREANGTFINLGTIKSKILVVHHMDGIYFIRLDESPKKDILIDFTNYRGLGYMLYEVKENEISCVSEDFPIATGTVNKTFIDPDGDGIYQRAD